MKKEYLLLTSVIIVAISILGSALLISNRDNYIKLSGSSTLDNDKLINTLSVTGNGVVYAKPDMVNISITVNELRSNVKDAQQVANEKTKQIQDILSKKEIPSKDITTTNYSINPEYDYSNGETRLKGYRAIQTLSVNVKKIDEKATKAVEIIDEVANIDNVQIDNIRFDIDDKTDLFSEARELAFKKAEQKAKELSGLSGTKLLKPVSISDATADYSNSSRQYNMFQVQEMRNDASESIPSDISTGQLSISVGLDVIFGIE